MIRSHTLRAIHYSKNNWNTYSPLKSHSDMRDVRPRYLQLTQTNGDFRELKMLIFRHVRFALWTWVPLFAFIAYEVHHARSMKKQFEVHFLSQLPTKEYDEEDYRYKFWEFALPIAHEKYGDAVSSENTKAKYVLMYHSSIKNANHIAMQRFSRLKKYMMLRRVVDLECVFVALDPDLEPQLLLEYAKTYGDDILPTWGGDEESQSKLSSTFNNLGCLYLFERDTGNVIYITDPAKYPLEALSNKLLYVIGRYEDLQKSKDWMEKGVDFRIGQEDKLMIRKANY